MRLAYPAAGSECRCRIVSSDGGSFGVRARGVAQHPTVQGPPPLACSQSDRRATDLCYRTRRRAFRGLPRGAPSSAVGGCTRAGGRGQGWRGTREGRTRGCRFSSRLERNRAGICATGRGASLAGRAVADGSGGEARQARPRRFVGGLSDVRRLDLEKVDAVRGRGAGWYYPAAAALSGAGAGLVITGGEAATAASAGAASAPSLGAIAGAFAGDAAVVLGLSSRAVGHVALYYGYDPEDPSEKLFIMSVVNAGTAMSASAKTAALADISRLTQAERAPMSGPAVMRLGVG